MHDWNKETHPFKAKARKAMFEFFDNRFKSVLMLPSVRAECVKEAMRQGMLNTNADALFVERDIATFSAMRAECESIGFERALYVQRELSEVDEDRTYDLAYIDLCGVVGANICLWMIDYLADRLRDGSCLAITYSACPRNADFPKDCYKFFRENKERRRYVYEFSKIIGIPEETELTQLMVMDAIMTNFNCEVLPLSHRDIGPYRMTTLCFRDIRRTDQPRNRFSDEFREFTSSFIERTNTMSTSSAHKAWNTRRSVKQKRSEAAKKAWETRRNNERARKRSEAAKKAWETRRSQQA